MSAATLSDAPFPSHAAGDPEALIARCARYRETPLIDEPALADALGVSRIHLKDERERMDMGSFKALGAAYVIAKDAENGVARGRSYVTASAGNHGLSVAAGASAFGARAIVYIAQTVPDAFARRLRAHGAEVRREGAQYEEAMAAASKAAATGEAELLSDSSWPGYFERPHRLMEGYLVLMAEVFRQIPRTPTHILLQAGVGGLAGAAAAAARHRWSDAPRICVVEPAYAPALQASIEAGAPVITSGPASDMGRLDCKEASLIALRGLSRDADDFVTVAEEDTAKSVALLAAHGLETTPSGGAALAPLVCGGADLRAALGLHADARVLAILSEGPEE